MPTVADLQALAQSLQVVLDGPTAVQPGRLLTATISPDVSALKVTDSVAGSLDLTFLTKNVRFGNKNLEAALDPATLDPKITKGMPILGILGDIGSTTDVPGTIGQVKGTLPLGALQVPVNAAVTWVVFATKDANGNPVPLGASEVATSPGGLSSPSVSILFAPNVIELAIGIDPSQSIKTRFIRATVTLSVGPVSSGPVPLPDITIQAFPLATPTVFSLFRNKDFQAMDGSTEGLVLVVVPSASPVKGFSDILSTLASLQSMVSGLTAFANFLAFASRLSLLVSSLNSIRALDVTTGRTHTAFQATDSIVDLSPIHYWSEGLFGLYDVNAAERMNALILIGRAGRTVECSNDNSFNSDQGQFTVTVGSTSGLPDLFVTARDLGSATPPSDPTTALTVTAPPAGTRRVFHNITTFGSELHSIRFTA